MTRAPELLAEDDWNAAVRAAQGAIAEQRCERGTPWDLACQACYAAVSALIRPTAPASADLAAIRARCEAATEGPWALKYHDNAGGLNEWLLGPDDKHVYGVQLWDTFYNEAGSANAAFIAHARTDIPALLTALTAALAEGERLKEQVAERGQIIGQLHALLAGGSE